MIRNHRFVIVHQYNPNSVFKAGIESFINDLIENNVFPNGSLLLGIKNSKNILGESVWFQGNIEGRSVATDKRGFIPVSLRLYLFSAIYLLKTQPRVVYVCRFDYVFPIKLLCPFSKILLSIHTDGEKLLSQESDSAWANLKNLAKFVESMAMRISSVVFCHSKSEFRRWSKLYGHKLSYIPASFESRNFFPGNDERNLIIWAGRLETVKNPVLALQVLCSLDIPGFQSRMYGSGSLIEEIRIINENHGNRTQLSEAVNSEDFGEILRRTKILISTSYFEGAPRILVEALACGVRIVCLSSADPHDFASEFPNHCIHVESPEVESFVEKIKYLIENQRNSFIDVEKYSNERVFEILGRIFNKQIV